MSPRRVQRPSRIRVAFLSTLHPTSTAGDVISMWFRETNGYRKTNDVWLVVHQHSSVPFDASDGKALLGLEP